MPSSFVCSAHCCGQGGSPRSRKDWSDGFFHNGKWSNSTSDITSPLPGRWLHDPNSDAAAYQDDDGDDDDVGVDVSVSPVDPRSPPRLRFDLGDEKTPTELRYMCHSLGLAPDPSQVRQLAGVHRSRHFEVELGNAVGWQTRRRMTELTVAQSSPRNKMSWGIER